MTTECRETLTDIIFVPMMAECGVKTIEGFANDVVSNLERREMKRVGEIYDKLQKMKSSDIRKHKFNYWKVMQCLGEVGIEKIILAIKTNTLHSCHCHVYSNLFEAMNLFCECLTTVNVIKRVLYHRQALVPIFFEALRQPKEPRLLEKMLVIMYRCLIVGKEPLAEMYMMNKILKDLHSIAQKQLDFNDNSIDIVEYCVKLLYGLVIHGGKHVRHQVRHSSAIIAVEEYKHSLERKIDPKVIRLTDPVVLKYCTALRIELDGGTQLIDKQSLRDVLKEECNSDNGHVIFCSAPCCRRQFNEERDHFRYCGACRLSRYCSKQCQREHWKVAHKEMCLKLECYTQDS
ncbi:uncharacterized protein LOC124139022 isoform X1 [Haliotis rufescens]|uniref:uncharacterized protein LOC124139022 isoform X1 n=2 Tax=Haliotis rufescens TaxID=6454 RepID=UPI001EB0296F|nr:uncharacterized protein LOC124139022 isoform X1 [Haliotis rufescens]